MSDKADPRKSSARQRGYPEKKRAAEATIERILQAARGVLIERGHVGFTTRRVAEAAGISPGNLSYHFPTKRQLLQALINRLVADYSEQFGELLGNAEIPADIGLENLVRWLLNDAVLEEGVRTFRELWAMSLHDPVIARATDDLYDQLMGHVEALLRRSNPHVDAVAVREVVQYLALVSEGSIVLYGTRRQRAVSFERVIELTIWMIKQIAPGLSSSEGQ